jgi:UTP--glucose-1-phosphate uridylyltransferase
MMKRMRTLRIKKAVVAVAGSGTRFLPAVKSMPKEMLPIVDKPIIQLVVEELVAAGITDIILVTKWDKKPLEDHFDYNAALAMDLKRAGKLAELEKIQRISEMANFIYVRQKGPYGNGTPVLSAANLVQDEPFVYAFGDDLVRSKVSFTKQMVDAYATSGHPMIGVQKVPRSEVHRYGVVKLRRGTMEVEGIVEKPSTAEAPSRLVTFGRMVLDQNIVDILRRTPLGRGGELWMMDAITRYARNGGVFLAKEIEDGEWLTTGDPLNYLKAVLTYALERKDIGRELKRYIRQSFLRKRGQGY